ncbi:HET domain-containing protein [Fusarium sp. LHS14.1]|nr:HET domain-containing protein [Fusarium sp. LHS14.1]
MASVYANGTLNLAASYSTDSHGGLMLERSRLQVTSCYWEHTCKSVVSHRGDGLWMEAKKVCWAFDPQSEFETLGTGGILPLLSRGWVLQENVLSPRTLHFLPGEIIWECRGVLARESFHYQNQPSSRPSYEFSGKNFRSHIPVIQNELKTFSQPPFSNTSLDASEQWGQETASSASSPETQHQPYRSWYELVTQYCQKELTKAEDRFPAIWALAERFQQMTGDEYCAGLWRNDILTGLLFKRFQSRPSKPHASLGLSTPSWSWAAIESRVEFEYKSSPSSATLSNSPQLSDAQIQSILLTPLESVPVPMGRTTQAELKIRTYMRQMVGHGLNSNPSPAERAAEILGISWMETDVSRMYEDLEGEYELGPGQTSLARSGETFLSHWLGSSPKDKWIRSRPQERYGKGHRIPNTYSYEGTNFYFGWSGTRHKESALWEQQRKEI